MTPSETTTTPATGHTPLPWRASDNCVLTDVDMSKLPVTVRRICDCKNPNYIAPQVAVANAAFIALAANAHDDLVAACKAAEALLASLPEDYAVVESQLYDAIEKAEGRKS